MIKHVRPAAPAGTVSTEWQDLADASEVDLTSEHPDWPIEGALLLDRARGWRAGTPGPQTITLVWSEPIRLRRVRLVFEEHSHARTQEFVLRAATRDGVREIVRQQFTFSPPGTTVECEEYSPNLDGVTRLELAIVPAIDNANVVASLQEWRVATGQ